MRPRITFGDFKTLQAHVVDRFVDFYIFYNHARLNKAHAIQSLQEINKEIISIFHLGEFSDDDIKKLKVSSEFWDSVQSNFSYDRILNPSLLTEEEKLKQQKLILFIKDLKSNPELITTINHIINGFLHLNWIRIADIVNVISPRDFLVKIMASKNYLRSKRRAGMNDGDYLIEMSSDTNSPQLTPIIDVLSFYPEKLKPGISYAFPINEELPHNSTLAIACHFNADKNDIQEAFEEYNYQFEKFRNYYHMDQNDFIEPVEIEKLRPLIQRSLNENKHLQRTNNIEEPVLALICWEEIYLKKNRYQ